MYRSCITNVGSESIANLSGSTIKLSRIAVSDMKVEEDTAYLQTALVNEVCDLSIVSSQNIENVFNVVARIESLNVETGFNIKQLGLFLNINNKEILFQISQIADGEGDYIPSREEAPDFLAEYSFSVAMMNNNSISCTIDVTKYAKIEDLQKYLSKNGGTVTGKLIVDGRFTVTNSEEGESVTYSCWGIEGNNNAEILHFNKIEARKLCGDSIYENGEDISNVYVKNDYLEERLKEILGDAYIAPSAN